MIRLLVIIFLLIHFDNHAQVVQPVKLNQFSKKKAYKHFQQSKWRFHSDKQKFLTHFIQHPDRSKNGLFYMSNFLDKSTFYNLHKHLIAIDLDNDRDIDFIFSGKYAEGYENSSCDVYFNRGDTTYESYQLGYLLSSIKKNKSVFTLSVLKYTCCADLIYNQMYYQIDSSSNLIQTENHAFTSENFHQKRQIDSVILINKNTPLYFYPQLTFEEKELVKLDSGFDFQIGFTNQKTKATLLFQPTLINGKLMGYVALPVLETLDQTMITNSSASYFGTPTLLYLWVVLN